VERRGERRFAIRVDWDAELPPRLRDGRLTLAKMAEPLDIVWSRPLPDGSVPTTRLVRENQTLVIEDLAVRNMVKNRALARAISDAAWFQFRNLLEYKARWYGREVIPCSDCGARQERMPLNVRTWVCGCGTIHDRDVNAARNLLAAGLAASVCGAGVGPQRSTPGGQSVTKQKPLQREP
jgi:transposase, IS605 OrfB family, central region